MNTRSLLFCLLATLGCSHLGTGQLQEPWYVGRCLNIMDKNSGNLGLNTRENGERAVVYYRFDDRMQKVHYRFYEFIAPWYGFLEMDTPPKEPPWLTVHVNDSLQIRDPTGFVNLKESWQELEYGDLFISFTGVVEEKDFFFVPVKLSYQATNYSTDFYFIFRKDINVCEIYGQTGMH